MVRVTTLAETESDLEVELRLQGASASTLQGLARFGRDLRHEDGGMLRLRVASEESLPEMSRWLAAEGVGVYHLAARHRSLEELFLEVIGNVPAQG